MIRLTFLLLLCSISVFSQYKFERERKVSSEEIPEKAKAFMTSCDFPKKIRWYAEENESGKSFEAKTFYKKHKYSIEFDIVGKLLDAEVKIKFSKLPLALKKEIKKTLSETFTKHKIEKTQIQYSGQASSVQQVLFSKDTTHQKVTTKYELVVIGNKNKAHVKYEFLFDANGACISKTQFSPENLDNIEF